MDISGCCKVHSTGWVEWTFQDVARFTAQGGWDGHFRMLQGSQHRVGGMARDLLGEGLAW